MVYIKSYMTRYFSFILVLTTSLICGSAARAIESEWAVSSEARSRLISGVSASGLSSAAPMGFEIRLKEGWKTYWKAPGPQGYPPNFDWAGSDNVRKLDVTWPTPTRFNVLGYDSIGYTGDVLLPLSVSIDDPSKPAQLD
ncbi:MAG: protein-disulfide reductase DsbD domain-containing protein, partial [Alphaproteobacteria bacterium]